MRWLQKKIMEKYSEHEAILYLVLRTSKANKSLYLEKNWYRNLKQNMKETKKLLQTTDVFYTFST